MSKGKSPLIEVDRKPYKGNTAVLLEEPDGAKQGILCIEYVNKQGNLARTQYRYISKLWVKRGFASTREAARAMFINPTHYPDALGEKWGEL